VAKDYVNQPEFFQQHAVDGLLPDHLMAQMLALPEGDISVVVDVNAPTVKEPGDSPDTDGQADPAATTAAPSTTPAPAAATPDPAPAQTPQVVLAKDGVHTIPFERLEEARQQAQEAKQRADALEAEVQRLRAAGTPSPAPAATTAEPAPAGEPTVEAGLFGDYSDAQLAAGIEKLVSQRTADLRNEITTLKQQLTPVQEQATLNANEAHWREIYTKHPDTDSLVESSELDAWIKAQPSFVRNGYAKVLEDGTASEVVELFDAYKAATGKTQPPPAAAAPAATPAAAAAASAAAAIAAAKHVTPTSLSEIPAGTTAHHDENAAMLELTPHAVLTKLEGLSPAEIEKRLSRIL
jgi:hypothetical protein